MEPRLSPDAAPGPDAAGDRVIELVAACLERVEGLDDPERAREEVERVCSAHPEHADAVRERMTLLLRAGLAAADGESRPRLRTLGRFRLVGELGRGGMGVVYLALDPRLGRLVALKALAARLVASRRARSRFEREIRAIAALEHPRIVPIYEVGEAAGVPYFAMPYVEGRTLADVVGALRELDVPTDRLETTHLERATRFEPPDAGPHAPAEPPRPVASARPDRWGKTYVETICRVVLDVADALEHAHEHGVVHRDVKPSNVLLSDDGRALLFDFGLAHVEGEESMTWTGDFAGTPSYVAPEQVSERGRGVDGRTDVYALGVTLFELLTLRRPFEGRDAQHVFRQILTREAPLPRRLNRHVPRDLETICLTALEKDPERRYQSAAELAADLRRFLEFRPVRARPVGWPRRTLRLVRRHPGAATAAGLAAAIAVGLPTVLGVAAVRIAAEAERARDAEAVAEREAERARAANAFLRGALASADPAVAGGPDLTVRELLDRAAASAGTAFPGRPDLQADVRRTIGNAYAALGIHGEARHHLERAYELVRDHPDVKPEWVAGVRFDLAWSLFRLGEHAEAERELVGSLAELRALHDGPHAAVARALEGVAAMHASLDRPEEARAHFREAYEMHVGLHGERHENVVDALANLGRLELETESYGEAERAYRRALALATDLHGERSLATATVQAGLGSLYRTLEDWAGAQELWERALETRAALLGEDHHQTAAMRANLARVVRIRGDAARAEELSTRALATLEERLGPEHVDLSHALMNRALARLDLERGEEAVADVERSLAILRASYGEVHTDVGFGWFELGRVLDQLGHVDRAVEAYGRAHAILVETKGRRSHFAARAAQLHGGALRRAGELDRAVPLLRESLDVLGEAYPPGSPSRMLCETELGMALSEAGEHAEAIPYLQRSYDLCRGMGHSYPEAALELARHLVRSLEEDGRVRDAEALAREALAYADAEAPAGLPATADLLVSAASLYLRLERPAEALPLLERAAELGPRVAPAALAAHAETRAILGGCLLRLDRADEAEPLLLEAHAELHEHAGPDAAATRRAAADLFELYRSAGRPDEAARWERAASG